MMMSNITMKAKDTIAASLAEIFVTIGTNRYFLCNAINFETKFEKSKSEVPILGRTGKGHKSTGWKGTGSMTMHYNTSILRNLAVTYKDTGKDTYFEIQVSNEDPTSAAGKQTIVYKDCNFDSLILSKFDADAEYLDEDVDFTFDDFSMPNTFNLLSGML